MLLLDDKINRLQPTATGKSYNFYADANHAEARQLVTLVNQIKARFRELQQVDEIGHMQPLEDVVQSCNKVLELVNDDPLAKILPKVEQLHAFVYEWQFGGWASKAYAVLSLHNLLTDTIIRWRRLELSTWANLFDMEQSKCHQDADSWWFIAYQVVIAAPLSMVESVMDLREYAVSLTRTLEQYFSGSIVGQFRARVALLRQFQSHLSLLARDYPNLSVIHDALANFVQYFSRYEKEADAAIQRGRASLEKKMKDVLLMASWKDTNINALRESAKKSHQKLFRVIRKFRGILGQEMKPLIDKGLADEEMPPVLQLSSVAVEVSVPKEAIVSLNEALPGWLDNHKRLANAPKTVSIMQKVFESPELTSAAAQTLDSYVSSLEASMTELRKETPSTLTDENKEQIKHLKTRKRKLFADTLRELRNMGLRYNLGQDKLAEQESLATVLASLAPVGLCDDDTLKKSDYYFHKVLCLAPKARMTAREHSEDLTGAEVSRSIGFVEGLLHLMISQRRNISTSATSLLSLQKSISQFRGLGNFQGLGLLARRKVNHDLSRMLPWAVQGLKSAIHSLQVHGKLGQLNHDSLIHHLQSWLAEVEAHLAKLQTFSVSTPFTSKLQSEVEEQTCRHLQSFEQWLEEAIRGHPNLAFILSQLRVWTRVSFEQLEVAAPTTDLLDFADNASTLCDTVLVAVESARKSGLDIPIKEDEAGWLTKHNDAYFAMIGQLHMKNVEKAVARCVEILQSLDLESVATNAAAMSTIAVVSPVLEQFSAICQRSILSSLDMHRATVQMGHNMTQVFITIASQGYCTPQEKSDEKSNDSGKVETGTGLGDGEGAEDISKDIQPDEDLSELAQEANKEKNEDMEDEKDAVDMADEDMEGDMGSVAGDDEEDDEKGDEKGEEEEEKEMDEEAGDVDDLDPTAVDEKMWDGNDDEKAEKDQQGDKKKGQKQEDEQMATEGEAKGEEEEQEPEANQSKEPEAEPEAEDAGAEEEDVQAPEEMNRQDQNVEEHDALELPEDLDINIDDPENADGEGDDDLDLMSDIEENGDEKEEQPDAADTGEKEDAENADGPLEEAGPKDDVIESDGEPEEVDEKMGADEIAEENPAEEEEEQQQQQQEGQEAKEEDAQPQRPRKEDPKADSENAAPSDVKGSGQDQDADSKQTDDRFQASAAQQEDGEMGEGAAEEDTSRGNKGQASRSEKPVGQQEQDDEAAAEEEARSNPFKKLGDALERWHRQQQDIKDAGNEDEDKQQQGQEPDAEMGKKGFQHLRDDNDAEDTQAMGKADNEEAQPLDESMAIDDEKEDPTSRLMDVDGDKDEAEDQEIDKMDVEPPAEDVDPGTNNADDARTGVQTRQGKYNEKEASPEEDELGKMKEEEEEEEEEDKQEAGEEDEEEEKEVEDTSAQLSTTHLWDDQRPLRDFSECLHEWSEFQTKSHSLSLSLTSQLRLILTPSQSTKLSGSFRTGKRLNIKRIIPYIASSYKRDKIWMRRALPTKRTYQIMLCVDDSKSMGESRSGALAMESLVMVSRSLTMLEAGQVGVMGFGADVFTAHQLTDPFGADAGAKVLQRFSFAQERTDIGLLIRQTIDRFRAARQQGAGAGSDLWQLALILSDGLTPSSAHEGIRRLLREAMEERIMIVFIIMDDQGKKKSDSVLELKEARFVREGGESRVVIERYLDSFPFQYYLIVHDLGELPSALAGLLRTWFAEVSS
ncbi:Midasin [Escovopsis weberi]|uniref:Midasin n=1 Tax=Escovopsis weberi TaxID=150374 RepID=A0A0M8N1I5_ESCWE|nr:Midasin [Escovopsis weberi]